MGIGKLGHGCRCLRVNGWEVGIRELRLMPGIEAACDGQDGREEECASLTDFHKVGQVGAGKVDDGEVRVTSIKVAASQHLSSVERNSLQVE